MGGTVLQTKGLTKQYGRVIAVDSITLHVGQGEIFGFLGLNGAGKTTMIRMLLGMVRPTSGEAHLFGDKVDAGNYRLWRRVGHMVETPYAYPELTVTENLHIVAKLRGLKDRHAADRIIDMLRLGKYVNRKAKDLSLGNAQRLGLAKALIHRPDLLILDEPTNGLDPAGIVEVRHLLHDLAKNHGVTIFASSHILDEMAKLVSSIGIIHEGKLLQEISSSELAQLAERYLCVSTRDNTLAATKLSEWGYSVQKTSDNVRVSGKDATERPDAIATKLVQANLAPTLLKIEAESLETYFLRAIGTKPNQLKEKED